MTSARVRRLGFATLKGTRHVARDAVTLAADGPVGDRAFCLVDPASGRVLRTVEHPSLIQVEATSDGGDLCLRMPDGQEVVGRVEATDEAPLTVDPVLTVDYWGRPASVRLLAGPHAAALTAYLGRAVRLAATEPGEVVWAGAVSVVTTGELERLSGRMLAAGVTPPPGLDARFRATITLDAAQDAAPGTHLRVGSATIEVQRRIDRCAVVDIDPATGRRQVPVLAHLERHDGLLTFGVDARVVAPGRVEVGDLATPENPPH
ncbi:MOSC domain-containing protein [Pedococcus sp. P5_B7]